MYNTSMKSKELFYDVLKGAGIGVACIVPGVSGGTIAVLLNVYDKILAAVAGIRKDFKRSFKVLWPILLGIVIGLVAMIYPIKKLFEYFPLPTITLFVGMIIGGLPSLFTKVKRRPTASGSIVLIIAAGLAVAVCFFGNGSSVNLSNSMEWWMYLVLIAIGVVGSCALTIPGISGSMLLLILGFWEPILDTITSLAKFTDFGHNIAVLACFGVGVLIGFILISKLMTYLFKRFNYLTFMGIIGFILGSLFAIYYSNRSQLFPTGSDLGLTIALTIVLGLLGLLASGFLTFYAMRLEKKKMGLSESKVSPASKATQVNFVDQTGEDGEDAVG